MSENSSNVPATTTRQDKVMGLIQQMRPELSKVVPEAIGMERFMRVTMTTIRLNPKLAECNQASLLSSLMISAQLGLEVGPHLGQAYLVPFKGECTLIIGYKGLLDLVRRSGQITSISAEVVYKGDQFEWSLGEDPKIRHKPAERTMAPSDDEITHAYAVAKFKDGSIARCVMPRWEIDRIAEPKLNSRYDNPWKTHYSEMAKKTPLRRLTKYLPMSVEHREAVEMEQAMEQGRVFVSPTFHDDDAQTRLLASGEPDEGTATGQLRERLKARQPDPEVKTIDQEPAKEKPKKGRSKKKPAEDPATEAGPATRGDMMNALADSGVAMRHVIAAAKVVEPDISSLSDASDETLAGLYDLVQSGRSDEIVKLAGDS